MARPKDHVGHAKDENQQVHPRHEEPSAGALADFDRIMPRLSGQLGDPPPLGNEKRSADGAGGREDRCGQLEVRSCQIAARAIRTSSPAAKPPKWLSSGLTKRSTSGSRAAARWAWSRGTKGSLSPCHQRTGTLTSANRNPHGR